MRAPKKDAHKEAGHDHAFKPAKTVKEPVKAAFDHMTDYKEVKINRKTDDGVWTEPRNFLTNPPKPGQVGKQYPLSALMRVERHSEGQYLTWRIHTTGSESWRERSWKNTTRKCKRSHSRSE